MGFVAFTILVWEHMITFNDEVSFPYSQYDILLKRAAGTIYMERSQRPAYVNSGPPCIPY